MSVFVSKTRPISLLFVLLSFSFLSSKDKFVIFRCCPVLYRVTFPNPLRDFPVTGVVILKRQQVKAVA
jgi:hypothetical protein